MLRITSSAFTLICMLQLQLRTDLTCGQTTGETVRPIGGNGEDYCEEMTVKYCANIRNDSIVYLPNARGHDTQMKALEEFDDFLPLIFPGPDKAACSNGLYHFLCSYYFPLCYNNSVENNKPTRLKPCRSLCEYVKSPCETVLLQNANVTWPVFFNCSLDDFGADGVDTCFGPPDPSTAVFTTVYPAIDSVATTASGTSGAVKNLSSLLFILLGLTAAAALEVRLVSSY